MKIQYLFLILFFIFNLAFCQEAKLRVLGISKYSEMAENKVLLLNFEYNLEDNNPLKNKSIEIQVNEFIKNLKSEKVYYKLLDKEVLNINPKKSKSYELLLSIDNNDHNIQKIINSSGIKLVKTYYKFYENTFVNEDKKAILALKNSQNKANEIAKILNYEILEIVNIDDDTSDTNDVFELLGINNLDDERKEMMYSIIEKLNNLEVNNYATKDGAYSLWVTYKIKAL